MSTNLTEKIKAAIEAENNKAETPEVKNQRIRQLVMCNPWSKAHFNLTRQVETVSDFPELAEVLKACPQYAPSDMLLLLPKYAQRAIIGTLDSLKKENGGADGE